MTTLMSSYNIEYGVTCPLCDHKLMWHITDVKMARSILCDVVDYCQYSISGVFSIFAICECLYYIDCLEEEDFVHGKDLSSV